MLLVLSRLNAWLVQESSVFPGYEVHHRGEGGRSRCEMLGGSQKPRSSNTGLYSGHAVCSSYRYVYSRSGVHYPKGLGAQHLARLVLLGSISCTNPATDTTTITNNEERTSHRTFTTGSAAPMYTSIAFQCLGTLHCTDCF